MAEPSSSSGTIPVAIVGAGFAGIAMGYRLKKAGFEQFTIFEKAGAVGGVWRDNTYPGAACDVPSALYSYSFAQNEDWTKRFPPQPEIYRYLENCADSFDLRSHLRLNTEIVSAGFLEETGEWTLETARGDVHRARVVVFACGQLNRPYTPEVPGLEAFPGPRFHSARWDHSVDLAGKRVAVVGNGASAVQFIPEIVDEVKELCVFQRSANWIMRKPNPDTSESFRNRLRRIPWLKSLRRFLVYLSMESRFPILLRGSLSGRLVSRYLERHMGKRIGSPEKRDALFPDYPVGCKRILLSGDYLKAAQKPNVTLENSGLTRLEGARAIAGNGNEFDADVLIFATGFESTAFLAPIAITGREGKQLHDSWKGGAEAYLGMSVAGFPNLFLMYGPNTNLAHNSIVFMLERQASYILDAIRWLERDQLRSIEVRPEVMDTFNRDVASAADRTVWTAGCRNWYKTTSGKLVNNWPGPTWRYAWETRRVKKNRFLQVPEAS